MNICSKRGRGRKGKCLKREGILNCKIVIQ